MATILIIFATIFVLGPNAKAYANRIAHESSVEPEASRAEIGRLREEVERLGIEVSRLQDEQAFMVRLLSDGDRKRLQERSPSSE